MGAESSHNESKPAAGDPRAVKETARLCASCLFVLLLFNMAWHFWFRRVPGALPAFVVIATLAYLVILRLTTGIGFMGLSRQARFVVVSSTVLLLLYILFGRAGTYSKYFAAHVPVGALSSLYPFFYFVACGLFLRTIVPLICIRTTLGGTAGEYGYRFRQPRSKYGWVYLALFILVFPFIVWASATPEFQASYPQAKGATHQDTIPLNIFVAYHAAYFLLFVSGESFWRGYMTFGLGRDLGVRALPWMVMLYSVAHYGKPFLEINGAIIAGSVLGYLAFRHGTFWLGVLLHWAIALTMDLSVIVRTGTALQ